MQGIQIQRKLKAGGDEDLVYLGKHSLHMIQSEKCIRAPRAFTS